MTSRAGGWRGRAAIAAGRLSATATRRLGRGGGTALPGVVAQRIDPDLTAALARSLGHGVVTVTGTNGKTTTAHLLTAIAERGSLRPLGNGSGSNMERGVLAALLAAANPGGRIDDAIERLAVLEVDEAALPGLFGPLRPRVAIFLNLFRDQLDRYGEVHGIAAGWRRMLRADASGATLALNVDDPTIAELAHYARGEVVTFGIDDPARALATAPGPGADARFTPDGHRYRYGEIYLGHLGRWSSPEEGRSRPPLDIAAQELRPAGEGTAFTLVVSGRLAPDRDASAGNASAGDARTRDTGAGGEQRFPVELPLAGVYSVYNALAAVAGAIAVGVPADVAARALGESAPAFGRQERFTLHGREVRILLAKNPTGLTEVLRTLRSAGRPLHLLAMLNDGIQDGRDVSWIYDADVEQMAGSVATLIASGTRAEDMALRWHLAGVDAQLTEAHTASALDAAMSRTPAGAPLDVVATYTAMLDVRRAIAQFSGVAPYWAPTSGSATGSATGSTTDRATGSDA